MRAKAVTSQYRGVYWDSEKDKWRAEIQVRNRVYKLGRHTVEEDAAIAYDRAATFLGVPERVNERTGRLCEIEICFYCDGLGKVGGEYKQSYRGRVTVACLSEWRDWEKCNSAGYFFNGRKLEKVD